MVLGHRRALLAAAAYDNQADVTVMMIEDNSTIASTVTQLNTSIANSTLLVSRLQELRGWGAGKGGLGFVVRWGGGRGRGW